jgi:hypothetical protein
LTRDGTALLHRIDAGVREATQVLAPLSEQDQREFRRLLAGLD